MSQAPLGFVDERGGEFKISVSEVADRHSPFKCPMGLALGARAKTGAVRPNPDDRWQKTWDDASRLYFALRDGLDALTFGGGDVESFLDGERKLTHSQRRYVRHALDHLGNLIEDASEAAGVAYRLDEPISSNRAQIGGLTGTVQVGAVHLRSEDRRVHEIVRLRYKRLRESCESDHDWTALAARVVAYAQGVPEDVRVRVSEFSLEDGEIRCEFDGTRAEAAAAYARRGQLVPEALTGSVFRPGSACVDCAFLQVCPAVDQQRGALGLAKRAVATRVLTASNLAAYDHCPTEYKVLRSDHLPVGFPDGLDDDFGSAARDRGVAVHDWLRWAHSRTPPRGCEPSDLPEPGSPEAVDAAEEALLSLDGYRVAYPYLRQHLPQCIVGLDGLDSWTTERRVVINDADADVVVVTTPDLAGEVGDTHEPIWRETKSTGSLPPDIHAAMHRYPAFALNIAMLAARVKEKPYAAHAELEVLTPNDSELFVVSTTQTADVVYAQQFIADLAGRFAADLTFERKVSGACRYCAAHRWCDPPMDAVPAGSLPERDGEEFAGYEDPF